jgi:hypothetical protein
MVNWLMGKKTYFVALGIALDVFAHQMSWCSDNTFQAILGFLGAGGVAAMRSAVAQHGSNGG